MYRENIERGRVWTVLHCKMAAFLLHESGKGIAWAVLCFRQSNLDLRLAGKGKAWYNVVLSNDNLLFDQKLKNESGTGSGWVATWVKRKG